MTAPTVRETGIRPPTTYEPEPRRSTTGGSLVAWLVVRLTGVLLSILVLGHFGMTHILTDVADTGTGFVARRWASLVWLSWDWLLLAIALLHGASGVWVAIADYVTDQRRRALAQRLLAVLASLIFLIGSLAIVVVGRR